MKTTSVLDKRNALGQAFQAQWDPRYSEDDNVKKVAGWRFAEALIFGASCSPNGEALAKEHEVYASVLALFDQLFKGSHPELPGHNTELYPRLRPQQAKGQQPQGQTRPPRKQQPPRSRG